MIITNLSSATVFVSGIDGSGQKMDYAYTQLGNNAQSGYG